MEKLSIALSILAIGLGSVAYWRSGGQQDVITARKAVDDQLTALKARQDELVEDLSSRVRTAYVGAQERMSRARKRLASLREEASESLKRQIDLAASQIANIEKRISEALGAAKESAIATARETQRKLMVRTHRLQARVAILAAQWETGRALKLADKADFDGAEARLRDAVTRLHEAEELLGDDAAYDGQLAAIHHSLPEAIAAAKAKAEGFRARIEKVVADSDELISALEGSEKEAEETADNP